ncbi:MAG: DUF1963 domain-containing protein [Planctomycetaceae bacterium]|nr:DUF1963 domain-containing protein [Planctomycetaceae bacterium]
MAWRMERAIDLLKTCREMPPSRKRTKCVASAFTRLKELSEKTVLLQARERDDAKWYARVSHAAKQRQLPSELQGKAYAVPREKAPAHHDVFDFPYWSDLTRDADSNEGCIINGPMDICSAEQARGLHFCNYDFGRCVPVDVFVWQTAPPSMPFLTKLGGTPYRPESVPWPTDKQGRPFTFVAQICFLDSMSIIPVTLPGDVMLVFFRSSDSFSGWNDEVYVEWWKIGLDEPMRPEDCPMPSFTVPELTGVLHRTYDFPDAGDIFESEGHDAADLIATTQATKIGTETFFIQGDPRTSDEETLICALRSLAPSGPWPFVDLPELPESRDSPQQTKHTIEADGWSRYSMLFGDCGCMYFFQGIGGITKASGDCY